MLHPRSTVLCIAVGTAFLCNGQTYFSTRGGVPLGAVYRATDWCDPQLLAASSSFYYADITVLTDRRLLGYLHGSPFGFHLIDTITGTPSLLGAGYTPSAIALETESDTTVLFAVVEQPYLYRLDLTDLSVSTVGNMGYWPNGDLLLLGDDLFLAAYAHALLRIELSPDHQSIEQVINIGSLSPSNVWGLALPAGFQDVYPDCILATAGEQLYAVNTITAAMTPICNLLSYPHQFAGAAAIRGDPLGKPTAVQDGGPCNWSPREGALLMGEGTHGADLMAWLPSTHTLLEWNLFDATGRHVVRDHAPPKDVLERLPQGLYMLQCLVKDPCGRNILVPAMRLCK